MQTYDERQQLQIIAQSSYFIAIVVVQWMNVIIAKTSRESIFRHGMGSISSFSANNCFCQKKCLILNLYFIFRNWFMNFSIVFETALAVFFCYTPGVNTVLATSQVMGWVWLCSVPFFFYLFIYDELRKLIIRKYPNSFLGKELLV